MKKCRFASQNLKNTVFPPPTPKFCSCVVSGTKQRQTSAWLGSLSGAFLWFPHTMPAAPSLVLALKSRTGRQTRKGPWEGSRGLDGRLHTFLFPVHRFAPSTGACEEHCSYKLLSVPFQTWFPESRQKRTDWQFGYIAVMAEADVLCTPL